MSALDQALEIPIVKLEHPRLCKDAAAELAALREQVETLKKAGDALYNIVFDYSVYTDPDDDDAIAARRAWTAAKSAA
jgi:hypothetical protein